MINGDDITASLNKTFPEYAETLNGRRFNAAADGRAYVLAACSGFGIGPSPIVDGGGLRTDTAIQDIIDTSGVKAGNSVRSPLASGAVSFFFSDQASAVSDAATNLASLIASTVSSPNILYGSITRIFQIHFSGGGADEFRWQIGIAYGLP